MGVKIGIIDADLLGRRKHRFPNLACEKLSGYWKEQGATVKLLLDYNQIPDYNEVYISKVFTDTEVPIGIEETKNVHFGGTGFYFDQAPNLPEKIEHHMPDYDLYNDWIENEIKKAAAASDKAGKTFDEKKARTQYVEYTDYSIGFLTRGCFRKCKFCVNQKYDRVFQHSPLEEFLSPDRKKICLLDDNFLGCGQWKEMLTKLINTGKAFKFKQGLDERLLTDEKCELLFNANYDGDFTFAFDNIADYELIKDKLQMIRRHTKAKSIKFYILVGFESTDALDITNAFKRLELLMRHQCLPYIMRYQDRNIKPWQTSKYKDLYIALARWGNQPRIFKKMSFRQFCEANQALHSERETMCAPLRAMKEFEAAYPKAAKQYFDLRYEDFDK